MTCKNCDSTLPSEAKFCNKCGAKQLLQNIAAEVLPETKRKSFRLDMSKEANKTGLMGIGFLILLRFLGPLVDSYLIAGIILGILFAGIEYFSHKKQ